MSLFSAIRFANCVVLYLLFSFCRSSGNADTLKENTLAMIKPDGVERDYTAYIKKLILASGFRVTKEMQLQLSEDTVKRFYAEHASKSFFTDLVQYMTRKENAVADWRDLIEPTDASEAKATHPKSIRAMCGIDLQRNCIHGSDSPESAFREIAFFFETSLSGIDSKHDEL